MPWLPDLFKGRDRPCETSNEPVMAQYVLCFRPSNTTYDQTQTFQFFAVNHMRKLYLTGMALFAGGILAASGQVADSTPPAASAPAGATAPDTTTLEAVVVTSTPAASIMPNNQNNSSVFGTDLSVQDTPRNITVVTAELLKDANITDITDFGKVAPGAYTTVPFGFASVPNIRGQLADVFVNGMERTTRADGPPTTFNAVEQADVVSGPPSSVLGPTANTGGYVDFITKQPFFDAFHTDTQFTYGSYDEKIFSEDLGGPLIPKVLAYRVSYEANKSGSYYENVKTNSNDGFFALAWTPTKDFRIDFNSEFYDVRFNENTGLDRPTQQLIDGLNYSTGLFSAVGSIIGGSPDGSTGGYPDTGTFGGLINSPGTVKISPKDSEVGPSDSDFSKDLNAELTETYHGDGNVTFINRSYYEYLYLRNYELAQLYTNLQNSNIFEDRAEIHIDFDSGKGMPTAIKNDIVTGLAVKSVNVHGFGDYYNESLNGTDLTTNSFPLVDNQYNGTNFYTLGDVPGTNFKATTGLLQPNTTQEQGYELSAFFQHQLSFGSQWSFIYSARADLIHDDLSDPIPNDPASGDGLPADAGVHYITTQLLGTGDASITFKPVSWVTHYLTFDFNQSSAGNPGGGFDTYSNLGQSRDYHYDNYLYEAGSKFNLIDHKLFTTVDLYYQTHNLTTNLGATTEIKTYGADISTTYQPDKHLSLMLSESYLNATVVNPGAELTGNVYDAFSTSSIGVNGTGLGAPNFVAQGNGLGNFREAGFPRFLFTGLVGYTLSSGLGASVSYQITDPIPTSELGNVMIPWQSDFDVSVFYTHKYFSIRLTLYNVTNRTNFATGGYISTSGNDVISVLEPFHVEGTVGFRF
jgi:outer membrane receptor protein involved in Fe transport